MSNCTICGRDITEKSCPCQKKLSDERDAGIRAKALQEAADIAVRWYRTGQVMPAGKETYATRQLRAAILGMGVEK